MKIQVFTFFILLPSFCFAQSKLSGFVREQNTGIKIPDVMVRSNVASNPIASSSSGYFILTFQDQKPGKSIIVRAEKDGWELVNEKEMSTLIPENPDEKPFKIILCKTGTLAKAKSRYYETFELNLQKELDKQKALNKGNEKKIASLEQDFARIQNQLNDLADEYSRIDLSDASEKDLRAIALFKEGKYDEFIALKNSIVTEAQVDKAIKSKAEATKVIANNDSTITLYLKSQTDIAKTFILQFKFEEAQRTYENIVSKDTTNFDNTFDFAQFLSNQNQHDKAIRNYQRALELAKEEVETTMTQNNLGLLYQAKNDYPAALTAYGKALDIDERLAKTNPATYEPSVALTQNNLGSLYQAKNDYSAALNAYGKALEIFERLAKTNPATYEPYVSRTQNNLGSLYQYKNDYPAALNAYGKALEIKERLVKNNPATYEPDLAMTQNNLGNLYQTKNDYPAALNAYGKALEIYERLAKANPATYEPNVAKAQNNIGSLYQYQNDYPAAFNAYGKALEIYERLAKSNPATYEPDVAMTQNNLGILYQAKNNYPAALNAYGKALEIRERLAKNNTATYEPDVAITQNNLGLLYHAKNDYPAALNAFRKALEIFELGVKTNPGTYEPQVAAVQNNLGLLYHAKNDYSAALNAYGNSLEIRERLAKTNPAIYEPNVAMTQYNLGSLYQAKNDYPAALKAYSKALEIRERLARINPATYEPDVAMTQNNLGILYQAENNYPAALNAYGKALEIRERLAKINPDGYEIEFCRSIVLLALLQQADYHENRQMIIEQHLSKAKEILPKYTEVPLAKQLLEYVNDLDTYFNNQKVLQPIQALEGEREKSTTNHEKLKIQEKIIEQYRSLVSTGHIYLASDLGAGLSGLAWYYLFEKRFPQAENAAREALNPTKYSKTEGYDEKIEWANTNLALALLFQGKYTEAEKIYIALKDKPYDKGTYKDAFLADFDEMEKAGITHPDVIKIRTLLKK